MQHKKGGDIRSVDKAELKVNVSIPFTLIAETKWVGNTNNIELFFYDDGWVEFKDLPGVSNFKRNSLGIDFTITSWPTDDRMIACGP